MSNSISDSLKLTIETKDLEDVARDLLESTADNFIDSDVLREIPGISTLIGLYRFGKSVQQNHNLKKLAHFLLKMGELPHEERAAFASRLDEEKDYREYVFEKVMLLIERLDDTEKAVILGNFMKAYALGIIDKSRFFRLCNVLEKAYISDLILLAQRNKVNNLNREIGNAIETRFSDPVTQQSLFTLGLLEQKVEGRGSTYNDLIAGSKLPPERYDLTYRVSSLGEIAGMLMYFEDKDVEDLRIEFKSRRW